jgi:hypothetical protein
VSEPAEIGRESLPEVPWVHPANGAACRLLTHRFKATKCTVEGRGLISEATR